MLKSHSPLPQIFISHLTNPWLNLSLETFLFKSMPAKAHRLLLYVNDPCVVIGRNQNPWRECNVPLVNSMGIPIVRRRSGGGTVCHDSGNVNFSIMMPKISFSRDKHAKMIVDALNGLESKVLIPFITGTELKDDINEIASFFPADNDDSSSISSSSISNSQNNGLVVERNGPQVKLKLNHRYDIVTVNDKKVSGSAYKIEREKAYHHGTMLLNSRLDALTAMLHRSWHLGTIEGRGVSSVKSPVANIYCDQDVFISTVSDAFKKLYYDKTTVGTTVSTVSAANDVSDVTEISDESQLPDEVQQEAKSMQSWDWSFGQTPLFTHVLMHPENDLKVSITVNKGLIQNIEGVEVNGALGDKRYTSDEVYKLTGQEWLANLVDGNFHKE